MDASRSLHTDSEMMYMEAEQPLVMVGVVDRCAQIVADMSRIRGTT